jgi:RNA polymerase sigma-70 factor (ECF subfamily)
MAVTLRRRHVTIVVTADLRQLMSRYCDGDRAAFVALHAAVAPRLYHYALTMMGDSHLAEDILQRTFLKLHVARGAYVRGADPMPWLFTIVRRLCLDEHRERRRRRSALARAEPARPLRADVTGMAEGVVEAALALEGREAAALSALQSLPAPQRDALVLTKLRGLSIVQAAALAGTTVGAFKVRAHRAYQRLRSLLIGRDPVDPSRARETAD